MKRTKGEIEAEISKAITQWEKDFLGRGSLSVKSDILRDMVIISLQGILTPAEYRVCSTNEGL
ncbi:Na-translocating system protein MpsC family protein, partial [Staphylococcus aureus]